MSIRPIQTKYRGYNFRSRLEARWAVFFDTAKIKWEYEPQGFYVEGIPYLPDFYLPSLRHYFEVKGTPDYDIELFRRFAQLIGKPIIVAEGSIPDPEECYYEEEEIGLQFLHISSPEDWPDGIIDDFAWGYKDMFLQCSNCGRIKVMNESYCSMKMSCECNAKHTRWWPLFKALEAARSARFEHGEKPQYS